MLSKPTPTGKVTYYNKWSHDMSVWCNKDNSDIYQTLSPDTLKSFLKSSNIENNEDINVVYDSYIANADSVLELGAGYGRVLETLLNKGYSGKLSCIERSDVFYKHLHGKFHPRVNIHHSDIALFQPKSKYDTILWFWSGFAEFSKEEQPQILSHVKSLLKENGVLIIDTALTRDNNGPLESIIEINSEANHRYFPTHKELCSYALSLNLSIIDTIKYGITTLRKIKYLYIFVNHNTLEDSQENNISSIDFTRTKNQKEKNMKTIINLLFNRRKAKPAMCM